MHSVSFHLETLTCPSCLQSIQDHVVHLKGVEKESVNILYTGSCVQLDFDENVISVEEIERVLNEADCEVLEYEIEPRADLINNA